MTPHEMWCLTLAIALTSATPGNDDPQMYAALLGAFWATVIETPETDALRRESVMDEDERITAIRDLSLRRFHYLRGDKTALGAHEVEGFQAEARYGLGLLEQLGDDVSEEVRRLRDALRVSVAQTEAP